MLPRIAAIYGSSFGHTAKALERCLSISGLRPEVFRLPEIGELLRFDLFLFFCPTYGDEELQPDFEEFIAGLGVRDKAYALCEVGNYYGYDNKRFGPADIIEPLLSALGWRQLCPTLSLDSMPRMDWPSLESWSRELPKVFASEG